MKNISVIATDTHPRHPRMECAGYVAVWEAGAERRYHVSEDSLRRMARIVNPAVQQGRATMRAFNAGIAGYVVNIEN